MAKCSEIRVADNAMVKKGQLLVVEESRELEKEIEAVRGELAKTQAEIDVHAEPIDHRRRRRTLADRSQSAGGPLVAIGEEHDQPEEADGAVEEQQKMLEITSPIDGQVVDSRLVENLLGRHVTPGQVLMEIADRNGPWEVEVRMPESRMGYISQAWKESNGKLPVEFILATHPGDPLEGWVVDIEPSAEVRGDEGNTVLVKVNFDQQVLRDTFAEPKIGAGVTAKIYCGRESIRVCVVARPGGLCAGEDSLPTVTGQTAGHVCNSERRKSCRDNSMANSGRWRALTVAVSLGALSPVRCGGGRSDPSSGCVVKLDEDIKLPAPEAGVLVLLSREGGLAGSQGRRDRQDRRPRSTDSAATRQSMD